MALVTLSFDNGPHPAGTPWVLEVLAQRRIRSTFFVLGKHLQSDTGLDLLREIRAAGHRIGNHTFSHEVPLGEDARPDSVELELERTERSIRWIGPSDRLFRPFGGGGKMGPHLLSTAAVAWLRAHQITCVLWNSVPGDFRDPVGWVERALEDVALRDHTLMVLHDAEPAAMAHLERFLDGLQGAGHTVSSEFPGDCLPLVDGVPQPSLAGLVAGDPDPGPLELD
jgi:peptidoglycan/xylan/chitin deacetylase (PgdA/CDA1 family)